MMARPKRFELLPQIRNLVLSRCHFPIVLFVRRANEPKIAQKPLAMLVERSITVSVTRRNVPWDGPAPSAVGCDGASVVAAMVAA